MKTPTSAILPRTRLIKPTLSFLKMAFAALAGGLLLGASPAQAREINFDDLNTTLFGSIDVPHVYDGMAWGDGKSPVLTALNDAHWVGVGNYNNPGNDSPSGENLVFNSGIVSVTAANGAAFDFHGAYFGPFTSGNNLASQADTALTLIVEGYNAGAFVAQASVTFQSAGFTWLQADLANITELRLTGINPVVQPFQTRWVMDNFTVTPSISAVPAPPALWVFLAGLTLLGFIRRTATHSINN